MATPELMALVKRHLNPLIFNDSPLTGVYTSGSDENSMKLYDLMYNLPNVAELLKTFFAIKILSAADKEYFDTQVRKKIKTQSFLEDKDIEVKDNKRNLKTSK